MSNPENIMTSEAELERAKAQSQEFNEEELEQVSGGSASYSRLCQADYYCDNNYQNNNQDQNISTDVIPVPPSKFKSL